MVFVVKPCICYLQPVCRKLLPLLSQLFTTDHEQRRQANSVVRSSIGIGIGGAARMELGCFLC